MVSAGLGGKVERAVVGRERRRSVGEVPGVRRDAGEFLANGELPV